MKNSNTNPTIDKAISLLELLGDNPTGLKQNKIAELLDIPATSCYRIIQSLQKVDWVHKDSTGNYGISGGILRAARVALNSSNRFQSLEPFLVKLSRETLLTCKISTRIGNRQQIMLRAESPNSIYITGKLGATFPIIEGSVGAVLLSQTTRDEIVSLLKNCKENIAEKTNPEILYERIQTLHKKHYCLTKSDINRWKIGAISTPIYDENNHVIAALTILGTDENFTVDSISDIQPKLLKIAKLCTELL